MPKTESFGETVEKMYREYSEVAKAIRKFKPNVIIGKSGEKYKKITIAGDTLYFGGGLKYPVGEETIAQLVIGSSQSKQLVKKLREKKTKKKTKGEGAKRRYKGRKYKQKTL